MVVVVVVVVLIFEPLCICRKYGFVSYMRELFTCPEPVMRYLCKMNNVHQVPIGTRKTKDNLQVVVHECPEIKLFYTDVDRVILIRLIS